MRRVVVGLCLVASAGAACGGGSGGGSPTTPAPTVTAIEVTLRDVVLVGTTATATATATMSNGQTQSVNTGWRSDATAVATVTDAGGVTGIANGEATIIVAFGGREGTKRIRVAPNYDGQWQGLQRVTACRASGDFIGICDAEGGVVGFTFPVGLTARHPGDLIVSGEFQIEGLPFPTFSSQVEADGSLRFSSVTTVEGIRVAASWHINSRENGRATGTISEIYSAPGLIDGDVTYDSELTGFDRGGATAFAASSRSSATTLAQRVLAYLRR